MRDLAKTRMSNKSLINSMKKIGNTQWKNTSEQQKLDNILNQKTRRDIEQFDLNKKLIRTFISLRQVERELGFFRANISPCLKGIFKQAYGFIWRYKS